MFDEILSAILALVFLGSMIALVVWYTIYTTKSELGKQNKKLESELDNLKIVNANLAKYNETLLKYLKK